MSARIVSFVRESNAIEGIYRDPTDAEIGATVALVERGHLTPVELCAFQKVIAPGKPLRNRKGLNVRVGAYVAPPGGPEVLAELHAILQAAEASDNPWAIHVRFERLHPFMDGNGRSGRALWAWQMLRIGQDPFALGFLHRFYYQTLANDPARSALDHQKGEL